MTSHQIQLVQNSWKKLRDVDPEKIGDLFYSRLFFEHPELRHLFPDEMRGQYRKLITMLNVVVSRLDRLSELAQEIAGLARRHVHYGVTPQHYQHVGAALLWTLERGLGEDWNEPVASAWTQCYGVLSSSMIEAAEYPASTR